MRPKELQEKLGITADRIKFYKREGLFSPENPPSGNRGTNYTDADCESLRLLEVLTKSGLTSADIKKMQDGYKTLADVAKSRIHLIEAEIERKRNSLNMLAQLISDKAEFETFDTDRYWAIIHNKEAAGAEFIDIEDMYGYRQVSLIRTIQCPHCGFSFDVDLEEYLYDESSYESENRMGPDCVYSFDSEDNYECSQCGGTVRIRGWIREYPMGAYDSEDIQTEPVMGKGE